MFAVKRHLEQEALGGTGLGLAMVQRFTRDLGGQLDISNVEPRGARVSLTLPCQWV
ncbi:ATP-binding protein [Methylocaldum sp. RMAD-M]|uniref:ATP-binding protein n=1 Tax=Methylocaldum sp. RMAD-M TaxID=2806557 RepID=UPI0032AEDCED